MHLCKLQIVLLIVHLSIPSFIFSQIQISQSVTAPIASNFAYPQSIFVDSPNGHIWITDFDNHRVLRFDISTLTSMDRVLESSVPGKYFLAQNYPNPFNPTTQILFSVPTTVQASLKVYNLLGQEVAVLFNDVAISNNGYSITFDGKNLPSGIYVYTLRTPGGVDIKKMCLLK
jgi:hypothetical protein